MRQEPKKTNRIEKVNSLIEHKLGPILHEFLAGESGIVTITKVETSRDMKWAKIWISILGGEVMQPAKKTKTGKKQKIVSLDDKILNQINTNIYEIQGAINQHFATKIIPRLQFFLDTSPRYAQHIDELIQSIHREEGTSEH